VCVERTRLLFLLSPVADALQWLIIIPLPPDCRVYINNIRILFIKRTNPFDIDLHWSFNFSSFEIIIIKRTSRKSFRDKSLQSHCWLAERGENGVRTSGSYYRAKKGGAGDDEETVVFWRRFPERPQRTLPTHQSEKSQSVSQIEKTVPHPPARHCSSICLRRRLCKRDRRKRSFPTSTNQLLGGGTERQSEIFSAGDDVSSLLIAHIISEWGERRTERKWDSFYVPSSDPRPWESSSTNDFTRCSRSLL
jgi:hypothetical protein